MLLHIPQCGLILFGVYSIARVLREFDHIERDLDVAELWSGAGTIYHAAAREGLKACAFDIKRVPGITNCGGKLTENICTRQGFENALKLVMRLKPRGLLWMAPDCRSFGFANSAQCKRKRGFPCGDESYPKVQEGNLMADIAVFLFALLANRAVCAAIENPRNSYIWAYIDERVPGIWCRIPTSRAQRCAYDPSPQPRIGPKEYVMKCTASWITEVSKKCACQQTDSGQDKHLKLIELTADGKKNGNKQIMKASATYPEALGTEIVQKWLRWSTTASPMEAAGVPGVMTECVTGATAVGKPTTDIRRCGQLDAWSSDDDGAGADANGGVSGASSILIASRAVASTALAAGPNRVLAPKRQRITQAWSSSSRSNSAESARAWSD